MLKEIKELENTILEQDSIISDLKEQLEETKYNGYTNKPTWSIMNWINNDQIIHNHFQNIIHKNFIDRTKVGIVNKIVIGDYIKSWFSNYNDDTSGLLGEANPIADILGYVLAIINWEEIAEHLIDDYESEVK